MSWKKFESFREFRHYFIIILIGFLLFLITKSGFLNPLINLSQIVTVPLQSSFAHSVRNTKNVIQTFSEIGNLRSNNATLRKENALLRAENTTLKLLEKENQSLRAQLKTPKINLKIIATAAPIGNGAIGTKNILLIDKGSNNKIKKKDLVLVGNILVGQIIEITPKMSSVQLLSDPATKIPAITSGKAEGIVSGDFGSGIKLTDVVQEKVLNIGELIFTSGRNNWPKGLVLGEIEKVNKIDKEFFQKAEVKSSINIDDLDLVYVVSFD